MQGQLIANVIISQRAAPDEALAFRARAVADAGAVSSENFVASDRHKLEANYFDYARALKKAARRFKRAATAPFVPSMAAPVAEPILHRDAAE